MLENLDFEGRKKRCEFRLIGLNTKKNDIIKSINRMQKFLIEKRNKLQEVDKEICKTEEEIFTLEAQEFALNLKNNKVDIKKLNANKVAQTIIEQKDILLKEENEAPIYFLYEMVQKALEINVVGFLNDWGYRRNEKKNLYEIDFYFDTVDKDIAVNLVKHVIEVFSMNAKSKVEEVIELAEVKNGVV